MKPLLNHTLTAPICPHPLIKNWLNVHYYSLDKCIIHFTILYCFDISQQRITDALTYISVLPNATKGSRSESVSQLQSVSYVTLLPVCIQPYRLSSLSAASTENFVFFRFTLTIDHLGESCHTDSNAHCISAGLQSRFTVSTGSRPHSGYVCTLCFQEPCANTEWKSCHLMTQHYVYVWVRVHFTSMQLQHTSWKLACMRVRVCVLRAWNTGEVETFHR